MSEYDPSREPRRDHDDTQPIVGSEAAPPVSPPGPGTPHAAATAGDAEGAAAQPEPVGARVHVTPDAAHQHRYEGREHTATYDTRGWGGAAGYGTAQGYDPYAGSGAGGWPSSEYDDRGSSFFGGPAQGHPSQVPSRPRRPRSGGLVAGALIGALVVGGIAGFGGAATYDLLNGSGSSSSDSRTTTASVVERQDSPAVEGSAEDVANSVLPSVVKINVRGSEGQGSGSGVIISGDGEILTNYHVVKVAEEGGGAVSVGFNDGTTATADVVGVDPLTDLAVIKAQDVSGLTPAALGKSGNLDVGEEVVAIGSPFGLEATVTSGIVSALHRPVSISDEGSAISTTYPAIQTDAAINPGNSGGPLVNMQGEVVGINSSIRTSSSSMGQGGSIGLGFAIPLDEVLPIVDQLRNGEAATHAMLGVTVSDASSEDGLLSGAGIGEVTPGSAAEEAGLESGDVITKVNDRLVTDASSLVATIRGHRPGDTVTLTVARGDERLDVDVTLDSDEGDPLS